MAKKQNKKNNRAKANEDIKQNKKGSVTKATEKARQLKEQKRKRDRNIRILFISILTVVVLVIGAVIAIITISNSNQQQAKVDSSINLINDPNLVKPTIVNSTGGIEIGLNGGLTANAGKPTLEIFSDFICPACQAFDNTNMSGFLDKAQSGDITLVLRPVAILDDYSMGDNYSTRAASFFWYIAQNDPSKLIDVYAKLYSPDFMPKEGSDYKPVSDADLQNLAKSLGVSDDVAAKSTGGTYKAFVNATSEYALNAPQYEIQGTPSVFINGQKLTEIKTVNDKLQEAINNSKQQ